MKSRYFVSFLFLSIILSSCNNGEIKNLNEKIDSLTKANTELQKEVNGYKLSPAKLLADTKQSYADKAYYKVKENLNLLKQYHPESPELEAVQKIQDQVTKDLETARKMAEEKAERAEAERKAKMAPIERIMDKYGCNEDIAKLIMNKQVRRGMTSEQCRAAWGRPRDINRTTGSYGVHEQWVYGGHNYLYFEDGILTTIQN